MEEQGYQRLIKGLAPNVDDSQGPAPSLGSPQGPPIATVGDAPLAAPSGSSEGEPRAPQRALLTPPPGSAAAGTGDRQIDLTPDELGFAQRLGGLVATPRAAKRLLNTYRLVRATQGTGAGSRFVGADRAAGESTQRRACSPSLRASRPRRTMSCSPSSGPENARQVGGRGAISSNRCTRLRAARAARSRPRRPARSKVTSIAGSSSSKDCSTRSSSIP